MVTSIFNHWVVVSWTSSVCTNLASYGGAFTYANPITWNLLPTNLKNYLSPTTFKCHIRPYSSLPTSAVHLMSDTTAMQ